MRHLDPKRPPGDVGRALGSNMVLADAQIRLDFALDMVDT